MMVVPVLITNCRVSEKWKKGPETIQMTITRRPSANELGAPTLSAVKWAKFRNHWSSLVFGTRLWSGCDVLFKCMSNNLAIGVPKRSRVAPVPDM